MKKRPEHEQSSRLGRFYLADPIDPFRNRPSASNEAENRP